MIGQRSLRRGTLLAICLIGTITGCGREPLATDRALHGGDTRRNQTSGTTGGFQPLSETTTTTTSTADADTTTRRNGVLIGSGH